MDFMITADDIRKLAKLSRMEVSDSEIAVLAIQIDSILGYVGQITEATGDIQREIPALRNVMRDDVPRNASGEYTDDMLANAPQKEGKYFKVKKIL